MAHHKLDPFPVPRDKKPLFVNEPWLIDNRARVMLSDRDIVITDKERAPEQESDNIRIYVPLDLNSKAILSRLDLIIMHYGEANEANELDFSNDVEMLISQIEVYDQIWYVRNTPDEGKHSVEGRALVNAFIERLENIPDGCAELFPFVIIEELKRSFVKIENKFQINNDPPEIAANRLIEQFNLADTANES